MTDPQAHRDPGAPLTRVQAEAACRLILQHSPDCIKLLDSAGRLLWINAPGCRLLELSDPAPLIGRCWAEIWPDAVQPLVNDALARARSGVCGHFTGSCHTFGGTLKWWDVIVVRIPGDDPRGELFLSASRDVTELAGAIAREQAAAASAVQAQRDAERARAEKEQLLDTVSHELRSPLNAMLNWAVLLQNESREPAPVNIGKRIERLALEQLLLVDELLEARGDDTPVTVAAFEPVDLGALALEAVDIMRPLVESSARMIACDLQRGCVVSGDPRRLKQVLINLLSNAIKFTTEGGRIHVSCVATDGAARLTVVDDGIGVSPHVAERIFEPYFQARPRGPASGVGLGLTIARTLVDAHGGTLTLESPQNARGSAFTIGMPLVSAPRAAADVALGTIVPDVSDIRHDPSVTQ